ncbi:MAG: hypothetical protein AB2807_02855 [Candidatus Sedimenticola endophacoides]
MKLSEITTGLLLLALILPAAALATPPGVAEQWRHLDPKSLKLRSKNALITDSGGDLVYAKEADVPQRPGAHLPGWRRGLCRGDE